MSSLAARTEVTCPLNEAGRHVQNYFDVHLQPEGDHAIVMLEAGGMLKHAVDVTMERLHQPGEMTPRFRVHWAPRGGPYPSFDGDLQIEADDDYNSCFLRLEGSYHPPLGVAGAAFDAILGRTIAQSTALHLLESIRDFVEHDFRLEEARKAAG